MSCRPESNVIYFPEYFRIKLRIVYERCCANAKSKTDFTLEDVECVFRSFFFWYYRYRGQIHPDVNGKSIERIIKVIDHAPRDSDGGDFILGAEFYTDPDGLIERYFETAFREECSYRIEHFFSGKIRANLMYDFF